MNADQEHDRSGHVVDEADPAAGPPARKRSASTARLPRWKQAVDRAVQDFTTRLKEQHGQQLADDEHAREFKQYVVSQIKRNLPPGPGHPSIAAVTKAIQLRNQGLPWEQVYPECISGFSEKTKGQLAIEKSELRSRCRSRRSTAKRRKKAKRVNKRKPVSHPEQSTR